jgi:hypothetical protein
LNESIDRNHGNGKVNQRHDHPGVECAEISEAQKSNTGVAMVKVGGNLFSGTKVTGPHSALVVQEDLKRLSVVETDKPDHEGVKRWRFELNPFR